MASLWNMLRLLLRLFGLHFILSMQYSITGSSPLYGPSVEVAPLEKFLFIVSLNQKTKLHICETAKYRFATESAHFCGGSLITRKHVLTAAHCFIPFKQFNEVVVKIGSTNLRTEADVREISWWYTYSQYNNINLYDKNGIDIRDRMYDIAIVKLMTPVSSDIPLPTISYIPNEELYNKSVVMAGWGRIKGNKRARNMRIGKTFVIDPEKCSAHQPDQDVKKIWNQIFLCSNGKYAFAAPGDSGSPLMYDGVNFDYPNNIIGVISASSPRGEEAPDQFMNKHASVNAYRRFIELVKRLEVLPLHAQNVKSY